MLFTYVNYITCGRMSVAHSNAFVTLGIELHIAVARVRGARSRRNHKRVNGGNLEQELDSRAGCTCLSGIKKCLVGSSRSSYSQTEIAVSVGGWIMTYNAQSLGL